MRTLVKNALGLTEPCDDLLVCGWVRTRRDSKAFSFLEINDGTCLANLQVVVDCGVPGSADLAEMGTGAAVEIRGALVPSPAAGQKWEMRASSVRSARSTTTDG